MAGDVAMDVFGWVGTCIALFFFISPCTLMYGLIVGKKTLVDIPWILLLANCANCILWTVYGLQQFDDKVQVWACNSVGSLINIVYLCIYFVHLVQKQPAQSFGIIVLTLGICTLIFMVFYIYVKYEVVGVVAMVFNIIMYAAPAQRIVI